MFTVVGALPDNAHLVYLGAAHNLIGRWCKFSISAEPFPTDLHPDTIRAWRFVSAPGIFDEIAVSGVWQLSQTRFGRVYPLAVLARGITPTPEDAWFDRVAVILQRAIRNIDSLERVKSQIQLLSQQPVRSVPPPKQGARFWLDETVVSELYFKTIQDLAENGFARMLVPQDVEEKT